MLVLGERVEIDNICSLYPQITPTGANYLFFESRRSVRGRVASSRQLAEFADNRRVPRRPSGQKLHLRPISIDQKHIHTGTTPGQYRIYTGLTPEPHVRG